MRDRTTFRLPSLQEIGRAIAPVLRQGGAVKAIVFGSYARGEADEYSDLDLIIVAETQRPFIERFKSFMGLWHVSPVPVINVLVYTPSELREMLENEYSLPARVMGEGRTIYEAGPEG